jgi:glycerol uptake facilitator-like aquaporin
VHGQTGIEDPEVRRGWQSGFATITVTVLTLVLVVLDLTDGPFRGWFAAHAFTTATAAGILVLGITVLIVDQVVRMRQLRDRSRATAAQAAIVLVQATRASQAASDALSGSGDRSTASEEVRTYMTMLLIAAPILIDAKTSRTFLEQAQQLGAQLVNILAADAKSSNNAAQSAALLDGAIQQLNGLAAPLLALLEVKPRIA